MIINDLIKLLQNLPEEIRSTHAWVNYAVPLWKIREIETSNIKMNTLTFEEAGKATRLLLKLLGKKPHANFTANAIEKNLGFRRVIWYARSAKAGSKLSAAQLALFNAGITDYKVVTGGWLVIHIPEDAYVSSFYASDNPEDWQKRNQKRLDSMHVKQVVHRLDGGKK